MSDRWLDEDAGPIVRPYTMTRGRTRPKGADFDLIAIVTAVHAQDGSGVSGLAPEHLRVLASCGAPASVAELASETGLGITVIRVLLGDLRERGLVTLRPPATVAQLPQEKLLREVLHGLKAL